MSPTSETKNTTGMQIVYVRKMRPDELPSDVYEGPLFAIHDEMGNRIGFAPKRDLAFSAAREHELMPVSVH